MGQRSWGSNSRDWGVTTQLSRSEDDRLNGNDEYRICRPAAALAREPLIQLEPEDKG